jgi:hypothetical protein
MLLCDNFSCPEGVYTTYRPSYRGPHALPLFRTNRFYKKLFKYSVLFSFPVYDIKNNHAGSCNSADRNFRTTALYGRFLKWPTVRRGLVMEAPSGQWHVLTVGVTWHQYAHRTDGWTDATSRADKLVSHVWSNEPTDSCAGACDYVTALATTHFELTDWLTN